MMAFQQSLSGAQFVVSVLDPAGKPLRERGVNGKRTCVLPFGSEYKIRIKSKTSLRALAVVSIDGTDVLTGGRKFVIPAHGEVTLERFVDDLKEGNRFKFVSLEEGTRSGQIQDPASPENGLVRVQIYPEEMPKTQWFLTATSSQLPSWQDGVLRSRGMSSTYETSSFDTQLFASAINCSTNSEASKGATVEGSSSSQQFGMSTENFSVEATPVTFDIWIAGPAKHVETTVSYKPLVVRIEKGSIWAEYGGSKLYTSFIDLSGGVLTLKTKDFEFASKWPVSETVLTDQGFEIKTRAFDLKSA